MTRLTRVAVHWPGRTALAWLVIAAVLTIVGVPLEKKLAPPQLVLPGGSVATADDLRAGHFGEDTLVLLQGPPATLDLEGHQIAERLEARTGAPLVSPWSRPGGEGGPLRPRPDLALIAIDLTPQHKQVPSGPLKRFERLVHTLVPAPITATVTGSAPLRQAITDESLKAASAAEKIAFPALLLVLLLVFRSVVAAAIPLMVAGATVVGGRGVLVLLSHVVHLDATSAVLLSMIGLALGVDYSLLIVTRFREARAEGERTGHAVTVAAHTAGRTASFAGAVLSAILAVTLLLAPPGALTSAVAGAIVATGLSVVSALAAAPALLMLFQRWIGPLPAQREGLLSRTVGASLANPHAALLAAVPLVALGLGVLKLGTVAPDPRVLPAGSTGGRALAASAQAGFGPGFEIDMHRSAGPLTAPATLVAERQLEAAIAAVPTVKAVAGPGSLGGPPPSSTDAALGHLLAGMRAWQAGLPQLEQQLGAARSAATTSREGADRALIAAADAGRAVASGIDRATFAARDLAAGSGAAAAGASASAAGTNSFVRLARSRLDSGLRELHRAVATAAGDVPTGGPPAAAALQRTEATLAAELDAARTRTASAARQAASLRAADAHLRDRAQLLASRATRLEAGLAGPSGQTSGLVQELTAARGDPSAAALRNELRAIAGQVTTLRGSLKRATDEEPRVSAAVTASDAASAAAGGQPTSGSQLPASGFTMLATADTAGALQRAAVRYVLDLNGGGVTGRITALTSLRNSDPRTAKVQNRLKALAAAFALSTGTRAAVGGQAAQSYGFSQATKSRLPLIVAGVALITFLALVAVLRSLLLAAIAVSLNLLTVMTMFGVLTFLYVGHHPVLGATGALDVVTTVSMFAICFALSIDYQVFLLARMREGFVMSQDHIHAIRFGIEHTARIVTGAALIMLGTFAAFGTTSVSSVQQFGIGLSAAILADATLVRLILLPAILSIAGRRAWWLPDRLERRMPELDVEGVGFVRSRSELGTRAAEVW
jgi:putative drug exporter of the RND superfamily